jgi:hypothetical protein
MDYPHNMFELGCPVLSRRTVPVEVFRFFDRQEAQRVLLEYIKGLN